MVRSSNTLPPGLDRFVIINGHPDHSEEIIGGSIEIEGHDGAGTHVVIVEPVPIVPELSVAHVPLVRKDIQARRVHIVLQTGVGNVDIDLDITHAPFYFVYFAVGFFQSYEVSDMARPICSVMLSSGQTRCFPATITP